MEPASLWRCNPKDLRRQSAAPELQGSTDVCPAPRAPVDLLTDQTMNRPLPLAGSLQPPPPDLIRSAAVRSAAGNRVRPRGFAERPEGAAARMVWLDIPVDEAGSPGLAPTPTH